MTWVYKADGTQQCGWGTEISIDEMRNSLANIIGAKNILQSEKRTEPGLHPEVCGAATGRVNAYELTSEGLFLLFNGFVGPLGFRVWKWPNADQAKLLLDRPVPWPWIAMSQSDADDKAKTSLINVIAALTEVSANPSLISELIGRHIRYYKSGDALTLDYQPLRVNIEHDANAIVRIWFG